MHKLTTLLSILATFTLAAQEEPLLKGVLLVDNSAKVCEANAAEIVGVQFDGIQKIEELSRELAPYLASLPLTSNGAEELRSVIASYYRDHNMRIAVNLPDQDTSQGVVQFVLSPERVGQINVTESKYTKPESVKKWVRLSANDPIDEKTLEQDVAWLNSNPYRSVKVNYKDSEQPGVTDIDLVVNDKKSWKVATGVDNTGTLPIGALRIFTSFNTNNFLFTDHTLKVQATTTDHYKDFQSYTAEYTAPLPWRNTLRVFGSYSATTPNREPYPQKHKESYQASARYAVPQWFALNPWVDQITYEAGVDFKGTNTNLFFEDDAAPVDKRLAYIGQIATHVGAVRNRKVNKLTAGLDIIGSPARMLPHQTEADFNNLRTGATPQYIYTKLATTFEQKFFESWSLFLQGRGQFSFANLLPSEQFSLGGYSTVRGYDEKVVGGDNALCGNLEIRSPEVSIAGLWYPKFGDKLTLLGFADGGYAWYREEVANTPSRQGLFSVGSGLRYSVASYFTSRVDVGFPLMKVEKDSGKPHVHFNAIMSY